MKTEFKEVHEKNVRYELKGEVDIDQKLTHVIAVHHLSASTICISIETKKNNEAEKFKCGKCRKSFPQKSELMAHKKIHSYGNLNKCLNKYTCL